MSVSLGVIVFLKTDTVRCNSKKLRSMAFEESELSILNDQDYQNDLDVRYSGTVTRKCGSNYSIEVYSKDKSKIEKYFKDIIKSAIYDDIKDGTVNWIIIKDTDEEFIYESPNSNWKYIYWISTDSLNIIE